MKRAGQLSISECPPSTNNIRRRISVKSSVNTQSRAACRLPDAVAQMVRDRGVSPRQAYRYLQQARRLKQPVPIGDTKIAFTVKLSQELVRRVRSFANTTGLSLSEIVSRALLAVLKQRRGRG